MKQFHSNLMQGKAAEYRVASELFLRGHVPYFPAVDTGVDLLVDGRARIQVKSTAGACEHWRYREGGYLFQLARGNAIKKKEVVPRAARDFSAFCDFLVLWAIEPNRFWVVPSGAVDGRHTIMIAPSFKGWVGGDPAEIQKLHADGLSFSAIGKRLGISNRTAQRRLTTHVAPKREFSRLEQYENRWDLIADYLGTLQEAEVAASAGTLSFENLNCEVK